MESGERNRDSRLLIALYSSWPMPASKAIRFLLFLYSSDSARSFLFCEETSSSTAFNFASEFSFSKSFDPKRTATRMAEETESYDYLYRSRPVEDGLQVESYIMPFVCSMTRRGSRRFPDFPRPLSGNIPA